MSEGLTTSSTKSQDFTQEGCTSSPDLNFSLNLHITASPALQEALKNLQVAFEKIAAALAMQEEKKAFPVQEVVFQGLNEEQVNELVGGGVIDRCFAAPEQKPRTFENKVKPGKKVKWVDVKYHPQLRYREDGAKLILNYCGTNLSTSWEKIGEASKLSEELLKYEVQKIAGQSAHKRAGLSLFLKLVSKGDIKVPDPNEEFEKNFKQFQAEEDAEVSA